MASRSQPRLLSTAIFHRFVFLSRSFSSISDLRSCVRQPDLSFLTINSNTTSFRTTQMATLNLKTPPVHGDVSHLLSKLPHASGHSRGHGCSQGGHLEGQTWSPGQTFILSLQVDVSALKSRGTQLWALKSYSGNMAGDIRGRQSTSFMAGLATSQPSRLACSCRRRGEPVIPGVEGDFDQVVGEHVLTSNPSNIVGHSKPLHGQKS